MGEKDVINALVSTQENVTNGAPKEWIWGPVLLYPPQVSGDKIQTYSLNLKVALKSQRLI